MFDGCIAIIPAACIPMLPGLVIPLDTSPGAVTTFGLPFVLAALAYLYIGYVLLPNSYGRYVMGIRVVDAVTGKRPRIGQGLKRAFTTGLWPVEAALIAFSETGQRLGDRWAKTLVVRYEPGTPAWKRAAPGVLAPVALFGVMWGITPAINNRMRIAGVAREHVRRELGLPDAGPARRVEIVDDQGTVTVEIAGGRGARVHLSRSGGEWTTRRLEMIRGSELGRGFSIQEGNLSVRANM
jgi:uncharacterized RDD family membrane protein YckC